VWVLWLLAPRMLLILCAQILYLGWEVKLFIYHVLLCLFYCTALWKPLCLFKLCVINKMDWIGWTRQQNLLPVSPQVCVSNVFHVWHLLAHMDLACLQSAQSEQLNIFGMWAQINSDR